MTNFSDTVQQFLEYFCDSFEEAVSDGSISRVHSMLLFIEALAQTGVLEPQAYMSVLQACAEAGLHLPAGVRGHRCLLTETTVIMSLWPEIAKSTIYMSMMEQLHFMFE